jgi:hypothetical protein
MDWQDTNLGRYCKTKEAYDAAKASIARCQEEKRRRLLAAVLEDQRGERTDPAAGELVRELQLLRQRVEFLLEEQASRWLKILDTPAFLDAFTSFLLSNDDALRPFIQELAKRPRKANIPEPTANDHPATQEV